MTPSHLAGVLESIAAALRAMPAGIAPDIAVPLMPQQIQAQPAPAPARELEADAAPAAPPAANDPEPSGGTMASWIATFRTIIKGRGYSAQTIKNRGTCINYIEANLGARPLRAIKPHEIATLLKQCSPHKAGRVLMELRDVYVEAIANGEAETNPAAHVKKPACSGLRKRLTLETWQAMFELAKKGRQQWVPLMLLLGLHTGQRRADLADMWFSDIVDGHLRVEQQKKAGKKVGARVAIPLSLKLKATGLTLGQVIELCKTAGKPGDNLLRKANGKPIEISSLSARFRELIVEVCGPDAYEEFEWPSLHEVRSLSARTYIAEGMRPDVCQTLLGHAHAEMTAIYLNDRGLTEAEWKTVELAEEA